MVPCSGRCKVNAVQRSLTMTRLGFDRNRVPRFGDLNGLCCYVGSSADLPVRPERRCCQAAKRCSRGTWPPRLYLRRAAIDKQLDPSDETGIVRREKKCRRSDLIRL